MLILTRHPGESVILDDKNVVTVLEVKGSQVKLGFSFPPECKILREELQIKEDQLRNQQQDEANED